MLDEVDKLGRDFRGDPASALLEVLDPEQNSTFRDNYLDVPFDLSKVLFITTANVLDPIPDALRDRMEIIPLEGYTEQEKVIIAFRYLIPRQKTRERPRRRKRTSHFSDEAVRFLIRRYTREAGVRNLEREIGTICRKQARRIAEGTPREGRSDAAIWWRRTWARRASAPIPKWPSAPAVPAWRWAWRGRRSAAMCCSSKRAACRAEARDSS